MRIRQSFLRKRYYTYARRNETEKWSDWTQTNDIDKASLIVENIRDAGFLAKLVDAERKEVLVIDR